MYFFAARHGPAQVVIEGLGLLDVQHPDAIGRVGDHHAGAAGPVHLQRVAHGIVHAVSHSGPGGIFPGEADAVGVLVQGQDGELFVPLLL